jgi:hypothetical protein
MSPVLELRLTPVDTRFVPKLDPSDTTRISKNAGTIEEMMD